MADAKPVLPNDGAKIALVNGTLVVDKGEHTGARPGKTLRGPGFKPVAGMTNDAAR